MSSTGVNLLVGCGLLAWVLLGLVPTYILSQMYTLHWSIGFIYMCYVTICGLAFIFGLFCVTDRVSPPDDAEAPEQPEQLDPPS